VSEPPFTAATGVKDNRIPIFLFWRTPITISAVTPVMEKLSCPHPERPLFSGADHDVWPSFFLTSVYEYFLFWKAYMSISFVSQHRLERNPPSLVLPSLPTRRAGDLPYRQTFLRELSGNSGESFPVRLPFLRRLRGRPFPGPLRALSSSGKLAFLRRDRLIPSP